MFAVIEYTNYRKEQSITCHGYFENYDNALKYSKFESLKSISYFDKENYSVCNGRIGFEINENDIEMYVWMKKKMVCDVILSKTITEITSFTVNKIKNEYYDELKEIVILRIENNNIDKNDITVDNFLKNIIEKYDVVMCEKFKQKYSEIDLNDKFEKYENEVKQFLEELKGDELCEINKTVFNNKCIDEVSSQIFAIVELEKNNFK